MSLLLERSDVSFKCLFLSILLFTLLIIPAYCNNRELSRAESRRLLSLIVKTLHSSASGCPDLLILAESETTDLPPKNHSYLLPLKSSYAEFLHTVLTPVALYNSYRRDIIRAASMAELVINWLSLKGLMLIEGATVNVDLVNFLEPLMRAFTQKSSYYPLGGRETGRVDESAVNSAAICVGSEHLMYAEKSIPNGEGFKALPPNNLCALMTSILEGSTLKPISSAIQIFGVWAPLHCNPVTTVPGKRIPLHLIIPVPHTKSVRLVYLLSIKHDCLMVYS